jgi:hypothetical protein
MTSGDDGGGSGGGSEEFERKAVGTLQYDI